MAVDGAQFQYHKFCNSLKELRNELSGMPLISNFRAIEDWLKQNEKMITSSPEESLKLLCSLNKILGECQIYAHHCNQHDKNVIRFNYATIKLFRWRNRPILDKIFVGIKNLGIKEQERQELSPSQCPRLLRTIRIIGFDEIARDVIEKVEQRGGGKDFIAYGITGMAGTGKSALAQQVFDSDQIRNKFKRRIWVSLSDRGDIRVQSQKMDALINTMKRIPKVLNDGKDDILKGTQCTDFFEVFLRVQNQLSEYKCLIVLDDIWQENELYESIRSGMSREKAVWPNDGAIIVTSRQEDLVKRMVGERGFITRLDHKNELLKQDCWKIFEDAVKKEKSIISMDHPALEKVKDDIKYKIQGLPLAAETLAKIIPTKIQAWMLLLPLPGFNFKELKLISSVDILL